MNLELLKTQFPQTLEKNENISGVSLCLITKKDDEVFLFIIHRTFEVPTHKDQLAFVGGHLQDRELPLDATLREFEEETGLDRKDLELWGFLPSVFSRGMRIIQPLIAYCKWDKVLAAKSNGEWDYAVLYPLKNLLIKENWRYFNSYMTNHKLPVFMMELDFKNLEMIGDGQRPDSFILWGATARMIWNLVEFLEEKGLC